MERLRPVYPAEVKERIDPIVGMGVVIINGQTGEIWAIKEKLDKEKTGRANGQLSIPLETRKIGESPWGNLEGAMAEAFDDRDKNENDVRRALSESLYCIGNMPHASLILGHNGRTIRCDITILLHDGRTVTTQPFSHEVEDSRWVSPEAFLCNNARPLARIVVEELIRNGSYTDSLQIFRNGLQNAYRLFNNGFSIRESFTKRELFPDYA